MTHAGELQRHASFVEGTFHQLLAEYERDSRGAREDADGRYELIFDGTTTIELSAREEGMILRDHTDLLNTVTVVGRCQQEDVRRWQPRLQGTLTVHRHSDDAIATIWTNRVADDYAEFLPGEAVEEVGWARWAPMLPPPE